MYVFTFAVKDTVHRLSQTLSWYNNAQGKVVLSQSLVSNGGTILHLPSQQVTSK
jgi:hypothetical protein